MPAWDPDIERRVDFERLDTLYSESMSSILATLLVMAGYVFVLSSEVEPEVLSGWYASLMIVMIGRVLNYWHYTREKPSPEHIHSWHVRFRLGILATGLVLGSSSILFFRQIPLAHEIFSVFVLAGMSAGALTILIPDCIAFFLYITPALLPAAIISSSYGDLLHGAIGFMTFVYIVLLIRASRNLYRRVVASLRLGLENKALAERLEQEKNRLDNRLGRILNDSSSELYVIDANTLEFLQVNRGALQHLHYGEQEIQGLGVTDILPDLDQNAFRELLEPLYDGSQEYVYFQGQHQRKDGSRYPVETRLQLSLKETPPIVVATALDITEQNEAKRQLVYQANYDQLTELPNRYFVLPQIEHAFSRAKRTGTRAALLFIDLDDFKKVNDTLGHCMGDALLKEAARRIRSVIRESDIAARLGGDEFLVLLEGVTEASQAMRVAEKLIEAFRDEFIIGSNTAYTTASIGISVFPDDGEAVEELLQYADTALYAAKQEGRCNYQCFSEAMRIAWKQRLVLEQRLRGALDNGEFSLMYQPKVDARTGRIIGAEALLRWNSPQLGRIAPDLFIPVSENVGLIGHIGSWVLREACREAMQWSSLTDEDIHIAVNVSSHQFRNGQLLDDVKQALAESGLPVERLELEITENLLIEDAVEPLEILDSLREMGVTLALDDFGTGYSSLSYLKRFPLQVLKIDRSFVSELTTERHAEALVEAIVAMAGGLGLSIVAEGVETIEQLEFLRDREVRVIQGYYYSPPISAEEFRSLLRKGGTCRHGELSLALG